MDDHGMTAAAGGYFDLMERRYRLDVPPIAVTRAPANVAAYIDSLSNTASIVKPIGDLYIGTHAGSDGFLFLTLFRGQVDENGDPVDVTDMEVLQQSIGHVDRGKIPDSLVGYVRATPPATDPVPTHSVHIKGCNIGRRRFLPGPGKPESPFLSRLQRVFGENVRVTAPKHFHGLHTAAHAGVFEYMAQEFIVSTRAVEVRGKLRGFASRADLLAAYRAAQLSYHDGTLIPDADWETLVPPQMRDQRRIARTFPLGRTIEGETTVTIHKQFRIETERVDWSLPFSGTPPTSQSARMTALTNSITADARFDPAHAWPMFERRRFTNMTTYMNGHLWSFSVARDGHTLLCVGRRFVYTVIEPIVNRTVTPPADRPLIFNFYPGPGSAQSPILTGLVETNPVFFGRV